MPVMAGPIWQRHRVCGFYIRLGNHSIGWYR